MVLKNKKGIFFTIIAIVLIALFLASYTIYSGAQERKAIQKRVSSMNNFIFSIEQDMSRKVYISGYRIIFLAEKEIVDSGDYISNLDSLFNEAFFNSTINQQTQEILEGFSFADMRTSAEESASKINTVITLSNPILNISQSDPWHVKFTLTINLILEDKTNLAKWNKTSVIDAFIPIESFEDPLYQVSTLGLVTNKMIKSPYATLVSGTDVSNLTLHATNSYYIASSSAPSFLDRLKGINSANPNGVESLVNLQELSQQGISPINKAIIDYIYFSNSNPAHFGVTGTPVWVRIDAAHFDTYNVTGLTY